MIFIQVVSGLRLGWAPQRAVFRHRQLKTWHVFLASGWTRGWCLGDRKAMGGEGGEQEGMVVACSQ